VGAPKKIKYSLSNAPADTKMERLAQMQGERYWIERAFADAKGTCGLADYQAVGWRAWRHHVSMVMRPAVHRRAAGGASAKPGAADAARHRRDVEGDAAAQAARQGGAGRPDQPASRARAQRHPIPLPFATQTSADVKERRYG